MDTKTKGEYIAMSNKRVVIKEKHYSRFHKRLKELAPGCKGRDHYRNKFKLTKYYSEWIEGTEYTFQLWP